MPTAPPVTAASRRVHRNRWIAVGLVLTVVAIVTVALRTGGGGGTPPPPPHGSGRPHASPTPVAGNPRLDPNWRGNGKAVTFAFGGDVNFPTGSELGARLAADPATTLEPGVPALLSGAQLSMVNFESALTDGTCPDPQPKSFVFSTTAAAVDAFRAAHVGVVTEANNHGMDCGAPGLQMALGIRTSSKYPILGIGQTAAQAFTPYRVTIDGQRIAVIAATDVIDSDLQSPWTATATQPGLASAYDVNDLVAAVQAARKVSDTVVVFLHWGVELETCPGPKQEPLANVLVKAGADIVVGSHAHVLLGAGYLGSAYVDYGLGNFAFYNDPPPTDQSGALVVTAVGRHIVDATWRPAVIEGDLPVPLTGSAATTAQQQWASDRACTDLSATPAASLTTTASQTTPAAPTVVQQLSVDSG